MFLPLAELGASPLEPLVLALGSVGLARLTGRDGGRLAALGIFERRGQRDLAARECLARCLQLGLATLQQRADLGGAAAGFALLAGDVGHRFAGLGQLALALNQLALGGFGARFGRFEALLGYVSCTIRPLRGSERDLTAAEVLLQPLHFALKLAGLLAARRLGGGDTLTQLLVAPCDLLFEARHLFGLRLAAGLLSAPRLVAKFLGVRSRRGQAGLQLLDAAGVALIGGLALAGDALA